MQLKKNYFIFENFNLILVSNAQADCFGIMTFAVKIPSLNTF